MIENMNEDKETSRATNGRKTSIDDVEETIDMKGIRICPRRILESLSHLRIEGIRIKPIESQASKKGGKADVEAAILAPVEPPNSSEPDLTEYIAVKKLRFDTETDDNRALASFAHEVILLDDLSHSNVVKIIGFVENVDNGVAWMVFSWEKNGNLREFIRSTSWELPERVSLVHDVARGLSYLHGRTPPICHGDLKSLNILVNSEYRAIVTDFGSARYLDSASGAVTNGGNVAKATKHQIATAITTKESPKAEFAASGNFITMTGPSWTVRWAAPELLDGGLPGLGSDVWALGWICWEAVTGNFPFEDENDVAVIRRIMTRDLPTVRNHAQFNQVQTLCSLMEDCLKLDANERPPAMRCQQVLSFMDQTIPSSKGGDTLAPTRSSGLLHALGWIQLRNGTVQKAQEYFRHSLETSKSVGDEQGSARAHYAIGEAYRLQAKFSKAEESYIQSRDLYSKIGHQLGFAGSVNALGDVYRMHNEYPKAELSYIQSRGLYFEIGDELGFARSVKALGDVYRMRNEHSKAEECYIQSRDLYFRIGHQLGFAGSINALGDVYRLRNEHSRAEVSFIQSRDIFSRIGDQLGFAGSALSLGNVYQARNEHFKAEESYIQSRDLYSRVGYQPGFAQSLLGLGDVYRMRNEYSKAEESYMQSRDLYSKIGDKLGVARSVKALGDVYQMRNGYAEAEVSYIQSRDLYSEIGYQLGAAQSVKALGDVYRRKNEYSKAEGSYIQSRDLYSELGSHLGFAQSLEGLGRVHSARRQFAKAQKSYVEAQKIYYQIGAKYSFANISWYLGWLHRKQAHYGEAERLVREATTIYIELGVTKSMMDCDQFLAEVRRLKGKSLELVE